MWRAAAKEFPYKLAIGFDVTTHDEHREGEFCMSRITAPDHSTLPSAVQAVFADETRQFGAPLNTTKVWARHPALLGAYRAWAQAMRETPLIPPVLRYLVYVRVASLNGCPF